MKTKTAQIFIVSAVTAIVAFVAYAYITYYISGLTKKTAEIKQEVSNMQITYQHAESLRQALSSASDQKDKLATYFVPADGVVDLVSHIEQVASRFGLSYTTQDISQGSNEELEAQGKELLQVSFSARGSWANIMRLIKTVESLPYGIKIANINMAVSGAIAGSSSTWSTDVKFSVVKNKKQ